jgi:hypothetical protein
MYVVKDTPLLHYPEKNPVSIVQEARWSPEPVWLGPEDLAPPGLDPRVIWREKLKLCCLSTYKFIYLSVSFYFIDRNISFRTSFSRGRDSSVAIGTGCGLDGPGNESRWKRDFSYTSRLALGHTQSPVQWVPGLSRGYSGVGLVLTTHPF